MRRKPEASHEADFKETNGLIGCSFQINSTGAQFRGQGDPVSKPGQCGHPLLNGIAATDANLFPT